MKKQSYFKFTAIICVCLFFFVCFSAIPNTAKADQNTKYKLRTQLIFPSGTVFADYYRLWAKRVEEISGGRLILEQHYGGEIVPVFEQLDAVSTGVLDAGLSWTGYWFGKMPAGIFFAGMPGGLRVKDHLIWLYEHGGLELWQKLYDRYNVKVLPTQIYANEVFCWARKPIKTLNDFKGLKIRQSGMWVEGLKELGAVPVTMSGDEVLPALERGVIDAAEFATIAMDVSLGLHTVAKYAHLPGIHQAGTYMELLINKNSWEKLPKDLQEILIVSSKESCFDTWISAENDSAIALQKAKKAGVQFVKLSPEIQKEIVAVTEKIIKKYTDKDPVFKEIYDSQQKYRNFIREYNWLTEIDVK